MWNIILTSVGTSTVVISISVWLIKSLIQQRYAKDLEKHRANLKRDYDIQVERLRADLAQQHFRFSSVFNETATTIAKVYQLLLVLLDAAEDYTMELKPPEADEKELRKAIADASREFHKFFRPRTIYLPRATAEKIQELSGSVLLLVNRYERAEMFINSKPTNPDALITIEKFDKDISNLKDRIPLLLRTLQDDFQTILGFPKEQKQSPPVTDGVDW